jgi:hypothetical protein
VSKLVGVRILVLGGGLLLTPVYLDAQNSVFRYLRPFSAVIRLGHPSSKWLEHTNCVLVRSKVKFA